MNKDLDVTSRLSDIARKSAELSVTSSKLADMASELDYLRGFSGGSTLTGFRCYSESRKPGGHIRSGNNSGRS